MLNRINQFINAIFAAISEEDRLFVDKHLDNVESQLFWGMNLPDQRHALNVAYTCLRLAQEHPQADVVLLLKCALLHDIGKVRGDVSTIDKVFTVLAHKFLPQWAENWGKMGRGGKVSNLRHAFYIYFHHAKRGADMLRKIGDNTIAEIIARHHAAASPDDRIELQLLRIADNLN